MRRLGGVVIALLVLCLPDFAFGQGKCGPREQVVERLGTKYSERLVSGGLTSNAKLVEFWVTDDGSTWTILLTNANAWTCIIAAGKDWMDIPVEPIDVQRP